MKDDSIRVRTTRKEKAEIHAAATAHGLDGNMSTYLLHLHRLNRSKSHPPEITGNRELDELIAVRICESIASWSVV